MSRQLLDAETKALLELGFIRLLDLVFFVLILSSIGLCFVRPDWLLWCAGTAAFCGVFWVLMLLYRLMYFVLKLTAEVKMLPAAAAKLAVKFSTGS